MITSHRYVYVHFPKRDVFIEASDVAAAEQRIIDTYPRAVFSEWQRIGDAEIVVAWSSVGRQFRHLMGEDSTSSKPDAFVVCQDYPICENEPT